MFHRFNHRERELEGTLTVEAALVLPIFIYCMIAVIYIFQIIRIYEHIQNTITEIAYETTRYSYVYHRIKEDNLETEKIDSLQDIIFTRGIGSTYYKMQLNNYLDKDFINSSCIKNGMNGITTYLSSFMENEDTIDIIVSYKIKIPIGIRYLDEIPMMQRVRLKGWNGKQVDNEVKEDTNVEEVYVALHGEVYHKTKNCTYIHIKVEEIPFASISLTTNKSGEVYSKCNICVSGDIVNTLNVYITSTGNKFHIRLDCSSLKRTVNVISIKEVGSLRPCSRCYKKN